MHPSDNTKDRDRKGRCATGEKSGTAKLSSDAVQRIKDHIAEGWRQHIVAEKFKCHQSQVSRIAAGKSRAIG